MAFLLLLCLKAINRTEMLSLHLHQNLRAILRCSFLAPFWSSLLISPKPHCYTSMLFIMSSARSHVCASVEAVSPQAKIDLCFWYQNRWHADFVLGFCSFKPSKLEKHGLFCLFCAKQFGDTDHAFYVFASGSKHLYIPSRKSFEVRDVSLQPSEYVKTTPLARDACFVVFTHEYKYLSHLRDFAQSFGSEHRTSKFCINNLCFCSPSQKCETK